MPVNEVVLRDGDERYPSLIEEGCKFTARARAAHVEVTPEQSWVWRGPLAGLPAQDTCRKLHGAEVPAVPAVPAVLRLDAATVSDYPGSEATAHEPVPDEWPTGPAMPRRRALVARLWAALAAAALVFLLTSGCSSGEQSPSLEWIGNGQDTSSFGMSFPVPARGQEVSLGSIVLCRSGNGPDPKIISIAFVENGAAVEVSAFAARTRTARETMLGSHLGGLADAGFQQGNTSVRTSCRGAADKVTELGITARSQSAPKAIAKTLRLTYESAGRAAKADIPLTLVLCVDGTASTACSP